MMDNLDKKLLGARNTVLIAQIGVNILIALAVAVVSFWAFALMNGHFWFTMQTRMAFFVAWLGIASLATIWAVIPPLLRPPSLRKIAIQFERFYPELQEHLIAAYDFAHENTEDYGYSTMLVNAVIKRAAGMVKPLSIKKLLPSRQALESLGILALVLILLVGTAVAIPEKFANGTIRIFKPNTPFPKITETMLSVKLPNSGKAVRFDDYTVTIKSSGKTPDKVWVYRKLGEQGFSPFETRCDPTDRTVFKYTFRKLVEDVEFFVIGGDYKSKKIHIKVLDLPRVMDINLRYNFPSYTRLASQRIERNDGNIDAIYGTRVTLDVLVSKKIECAKIILSDSSEISMKCDGRDAQGSFTVRKNGSYVIQVWDAEENYDPQPPQYSIRVQPDEAPVVQITMPGKDIDITEAMKIPIQVYAEDDFGFSKFMLHFGIMTQDSLIQNYKLPFTLHGKKQVTIDFVWDLEQLGLVPNDLVKYWVEGYDNDVLTGPKIGKSKVYSLRFPSLDEIIAEVTGERQEQIETVDEAIQAQKEFIEDTEEMIRQIQQDNENIPYEQREEVQQLIEQQQMLAEQLEQTVEEMSQTIERIEENQLAAQEIIDKMREIQKLLDEILPEELKEAMRKMQEALEQMDPELLKQAMKEFQMAQEELIEKLDNALELLRRIAAEMKLDELKNLAERTEELQDKINEGLESGQDSKQLERMEQEVQKMLESLEKGLEELAETMKEFDDMPSEEMEQLSEELAEQKLPDEASEAQQQMEAGNCKGAKKKGEKISSQLSKTAKKMGELQEQMNQQLQQQLTIDVSRTVRELLYIADGLEKLITVLDNCRDKKQIMEYAKELSELRISLKLALDRVTEIGGKTLLLPPAVGALLAESDVRMAKAAEKLAQGHGMSANQEQTEALGEINAAAEILLRSMESMCQSSSASGSQQLMEQLQKMCDKQGQINAQSLPLMGACNNPGGMNPEQRAASARLSQEQGALQKTMEDMQQEFEQHSELLGRMDQTIEDMKGVEEDLRNYNVNERTMQRQDRILSRMLDAQKSLHKREQTEKRRSRTGDDVVRKSPDALPDDLGERRDVLQQSLLQIMSNPYPRQYQDEVRKYFRALGQGEETKSEN